jgi:hypothetical protein
MCLSTSYPNHSPSSLLQSIFFSFCSNSFFSRSHFNTVLAICVLSITPAYFVVKSTFPSCSWRPPTPSKPPLPPRAVEHWRSRIHLFLRQPPPIKVVNPSTKAINGDTTAEGVYILFLVILFCLLVLISWWMKKLTDVMWKE